MLFLIRSILALSLILWIAWMWGRTLKGFGLREGLRVGWAVPIGEESLKFGAAIGFSLPVPWVWGLFGFGEGLFETFQNHQRFKGWVVGSATASHLLFGLFFLLPLDRYLSLALGMILHILWNNWFLHGQKTMQR